MKKSNWFRGDLKEGWKSRTKTVKKRAFQRDGKVRGKNTTVVFVPSTRGGLLVRKLKEEEDRMADITGFRIKFQEAGGSKLINCFDKDLGKGLHCGRTPCPPCDSTDKRQNCRSRNLVYESSCRICNPLSSQQEHYSQLGSSQNKPRDGIYIGETSRSLHECAVEHVRDAESFSAKSHCETLDDVTP